MRIELKEGIIFNGETGEKICDITELKDYGQAMYIIELLLEDRQKSEEDYISVLEENKLLETEISLLEETVSDLECQLNEIEYEYQMFKDSLDEWSRDYDR